MLVKPLFWFDKGSEAPTTAQKQPPRLNHPLHTHTHSQELEASDLVSSMGISITGHVKRLLRFIKRLQGARQLAAVWAAAAAATASTPSAAAAAAQGFSPTHAPAAIATDLPALDAVSSAPSGDWVPRTPQVGRRGASRGAAAAAAAVEASALQALGTNGAAMDLPGPRMFRTMSGGFMNLPPSASLVALKPPPRELPEWSIGDISRAVLSFLYVCGRALFFPSARTAPCMAATHTHCGCQLLFVCHLLHLHDHGCCTRACTRPCCLPTTARSFP